MLLVAVGVGAFVLITGDGDEVADSAAVDHDPPDEDEDEDQAEPGDEALQGQAVEDQAEDEDQDEAVDEDAEQAEADAAEAFASFVDARGTDDENAFSSEEGQAGHDAIVDEVGDLDLQGDPVCTAQDDDTVECAQDTDQALILTMGDDPESDGAFELIGASLG